MYNIRILCFLYGSHPHLILLVTSGDYDDKHSPFTLSSLPLDSLLPIAAVVEKNCCLYEVPGISFDCLSSLAITFRLTSH